jgi:hypothetical protein
MLRDDERDIAPNSAAVTSVGLHFTALENAYFPPRAEFCTLSFFSDYGRGKRVYLYVIKFFKRTKARRSASLVISSASKRRVPPLRVSVCGTFTSQHVHTACLLQPSIPIYFPLLLKLSLLAATLVDLTACKRLVSSSRLSACGTFASQHVHIACRLETSNINTLSSYVQLVSSLQYI